LPARCRIQDAGGSQLVRELEQDLVRGTLVTVSFRTSSGVTLLEKRLRLLLHCNPPTPQRSDHDRLHDQQDVGAAGVVGAELGPLIGIKAAFEERAEDRRLHAGPIETTRPQEDLQVLSREVQDLVVRKQPAVEVFDVVDTEVPAS